jgi:cystathionine gamma-synthase
VFSLLRPGEHVVAPIESYHGTAQQLRDILAPMGIGHTFVDMTRVDAVGDALRDETRLVWIETPSNPMLNISDIVSIADLAHGRGAIVCCDNTFATPVWQRPLELGADLVMHSSTKYFGGHSDVMGGALVFARSDALFEATAHRRHVTGGILAPFSAWLILRGCRSLPARMAWHCRNARAVAAFLAQRAAVEVVHYPGLESDPGHAIAARQMRDFGGMLSFRVRGGRDAALRVAGALRLIHNATSLAGCESLIEHRASVEGPKPVSPANLLRLSVGLEHVEDLIADLEQALAQV